MRLTDFELVDVLEEVFVYVGLVTEDTIDGPVSGNDLEQLMRQEAVWFDLRPRLLFGVVIVIVLIGVGLLKLGFRLLDLAVELQGLVEGGAPEAPEVEGDALGELLLVPADRLPAFYDAVSSTPPGPRRSPGHR